MLAQPPKYASRDLLKIMIGICAASATCSLPLDADAMTVQPVILDLRPIGSQASNVVTVHNNFNRPVPVAVQVEAAEISGGRLQGTSRSSDDVLVFPPQAMIQPGETQSFRIQYVGDPGLATSHHYVATIAELPIRLPDMTSAIQILYNFQVIVSIAPAKAQPQIGVSEAAITRNADQQLQPLVTVSNMSPAHGYLSNGRLRIIGMAADGSEAFRRVLNGAEIRQMIGFGLIGANERRQVQIPLTMPSAIVKVRAEFMPATQR